MVDLSVNTATPTKYKTGLLLRKVQTVMLINDWFGICLMNY